MCEYRYIISDVLPSDYKELLNVWESSVRATHHFLKEEDFNEIKSSLKKEYFPLVELKCIKNDNGEIIAFMGINDDKLEMLFVHDDMRNKGIGKVLLRHAIEQCHISKVDVNEQNEQAVGFYQKHGFRVTKRSELDGQGKPYPILEMELQK